MAQKTQKVLNCRLTPLLTKKFEQIKDSTGYTSDAECVRYMINTFESEKNTDSKIQRQVEELKKLIPLIKKKYGGKWPSVEEQLADMGE